MASKVRSINREIAKQAAKESELTVTLGDLFNSTAALQRLAAQPMPSGMTFTLVKIVRAVTKEMKAVDETRIKLRDNYGTKNQKTGEYKFTKANEDAANKEFSDLLTSEVVIRGSKLDLEGLPGLVISASDVILLDWLLER